MHEAVIVLRAVLGFELFKLGPRQVTVQMLLLLLVLVSAVLIGSGYFKRALVQRVLARTSLDPGVRDSVGTIARYLFVTIGLLVVFQTVGIDLSTLTVIAGALSVGIGFGLQTITNNLISGVIILFERPIKVGDRIEIGAVDGDVVDISIRATTVRTSDNIAIIVPNFAQGEVRPEDLGLYVYQGSHQWKAFRGREVAQHLTFVSNGNKK